MKHVTRRNGKIVSIHDAATQETAPIADDDPELIAALQAFSGPPTPAARRISPNDFINLFTKAERRAIRKAGDDDVQDLYEDLLTAQYIEQGDARTDQGIDFLTLMGLITPARAERIRKFLPPE